jgi:hypothetical protein
LGTTAYSARVATTNTRYSIKVCGVSPRRA